MTWFALVPLAVLFALFFGMTYYVSKIMKWQDIATMEKYINAHPTSKTEAGAKCLPCDSESIVEHGLWSDKSRERIFVCSQCNKTLYRSED